MYYLINVQRVLLSWLVSSGNLSALDVNGSEAREIAGDDIVTIGNEESCPWKHHKPENFVTRAPSRLTQLIIVEKVPWFKSSTLPMSGFVLGSPEFN